MDSFTNTPKSNDSQTEEEEDPTKLKMGPTTAVSEALISLVERAKHMKIDLRSPPLNLTKSCPIITMRRSLNAASMASTATVTTSTNTFDTISFIKKQTIGNRLQPTKTKARGFGPAAASTGRSVAVPPTTTTATSTLRKLRKFDTHWGQQVAGSKGLATATAPPPSPRSPLMSELSLAIQMADALKDEYKRTDVLTNNICHEAMCINEELKMQWKHQRDMELVQQIEMATDSLSLNLLLAKDELTEMKTRCLKALDQSAASQEISPLRMLNKDTQTTSALFDKSAEFTKALNQMRLLLCGVEEEDLEELLKHTATYHPSSTLIEMADRVEEMRLVTCVLETDGVYFEKRIRKLRSTCQRNAIFYRSMASLEHELSQMLLVVPPLIRIDKAEKAI